MAKERKLDNEPEAPKAIEVAEAPKVLPVISLDRFLADGVLGHPSLKNHFKTWLLSKKHGLKMRLKSEWQALYAAYIKG